MTARYDPPALQRLRDAPGPRPLVAAHRGDSRHHPENTLAAFRSATRLGVDVQEFDVRQLACGELVCVHDPTFDRTTDAARVLGPGALVAQCRLDEVRRLDAGAWFSPAAAGEPVPTLAAALAAMLPRTVPLIEHKAGDADRYVGQLRALGCLGDAILQSFDWRFLAAARALAPDLGLAALGPNPWFAELDGACVERAAALGAAMMHWHAPRVTAQGVRACRDRGLLLCTYTTDDELGWAGGRQLGVDVMCSNDPASMLAALGRRSADGPGRPTNAT